MDDQDWQVTWHSLRDLLGSKWSFHVLRVLSTGRRGFNELNREIDGMTATMLSRRLKELTCHGFVDRTVGETTPPTTSYRLTEQGSEFTRLLVEMEAMVSVGDCGASPACRDGSGAACVDGRNDGACVTISSCE